MNEVKNIVKCDLCEQVVENINDLDTYECDTNGRTYVGHHECMVDMYLND